MPNRLISGEWEATFLHLFRQAEAEFVIVSPFLGREPVEALRDVLCRRKRSEQIRIRCVVNSSSDHLLNGSVDSEAMVLLAKDCPQADISHLGGLHAKVYIADQKAALVTSANFTWSAWRRNREIGVWLEEPNLVREAYQWASAIQEISTPLEEEDLSRLAQLSGGLAKQQRFTLSGEQKAAAASIQEVLIWARLRSLHAARQTGKHTFKPSLSSTSENRIFASTILYLLRTQGPLTTRELHPLIQTLHPELCDDTVERIINGVHFGKRWKHMVRNAQQYLKRTGLITYDPNTRKWAIAHPLQNNSSISLQ